MCSRKERVLPVVGEGLQAGKLRWVWPLFLPLVVERVERNTERSSLAAAPEPLTWCAGFHLAHGGIEFVGGSLVGLAPPGTGQHDGALCAAPAPSPFLLLQMPFLCPSSPGTDISSAGCRSWLLSKPLFGISIRFPLGCFLRRESFSPPRWDFFPCQSGLSLVSTYFFRV